MYDDVQRQQTAILPGQLVAEQRSPIAMATSELEGAIATATAEYELLSNQLIPVKNEAPSKDSAGNSGISAAPSCGMEAALREAANRINRLTDAIRSTRNGLCI